MNLPSKYIWFDIQWYSPLFVFVNLLDFFPYRTLGRVLDEICKFSDLQNRNNEKREKVFFCIYYYSCSCYYWVCLRKLSPLCILLSFRISVVIVRYHAHYNIIKRHRRCYRALFCCDFYWLCVFDFSFHVCFQIMLFCVETIYHKSKIGEICSQEQLHDRLLE